LEKQDLIGELKIDRTAQPERSRLPALLVTGFAIVILVAAGWFWLQVTAQPIAIKTTTIKANSTRSSANDSVLDGSGYVTARRQATVSAKMTGKVVEVLIEEGMVVEENQLLATLDSSMQKLQMQLTLSQLAAAKAGMAEFQVQLHEAVLTLKRTLELAEKNLASQADLDQAQLAVDSFTARLASINKEIGVARQRVMLQQQMLDDTEIRAPFSGVVIAKAAQPGEMISPVSAGGGYTRTGICTIVDMDSLEIEVDVNESYINRVQPGQPVTATLNSYPDWNIPAEVITIIPTADRSRATVKVRIGFLERDNRILPDMGVRVAFLEDTQPAQEDPTRTAILVPGSAIDSRGSQKYVYVVNDNKVEKRQVRIGVKVGSQHKVVDGLALGEKVVAELSDELLQQLANGVEVNVVN